MGRALGEFEQLVLFALLELGDDAYGAAVGRAIEEKTGRDVSAGAIYTTLDRLAKRRMVSFEVGESTPGRGGRPKKYYRLEPKGADALRRSVQAIRSMSKGLMPALEALGTAASDD